MDRFEWFLEKATEIGVSEITPILCENSERKVLKLDRCERIIESAMKQSLKAHKPKLNELISFQESLKLVTSQVLIAHCEPGEKTLLKQLLKPNEDYSIFIGPEGDFSNNEIRLAHQNESIPISLGESRLRTETAGVVVCQNLNFVNQ